MDGVTASEDVVAVSIGGQELLSVFLQTKITHETGIVGMITQVKA
jgi:hypothetical protein